MCKWNHNRKGVFWQDEQQVEEKEEKREGPLFPLPRAVYGIFHAIMPGLLHSWCPRSILAGLYSVLQNVHTATPHINK